MFWKFAGKAFKRVLGEAPTGRCYVSLPLGTAEATCPVGARGQVLIGTMKRNFSSVSSTDKLNLAPAVKGPDIYKDPLCCCRLGNEGRIWS